MFCRLQEEKEKEELAGANKVSDPRKKGAKDDKRKGNYSLWRPWPTSVPVYTRFHMLAVLLNF